MILASIPGRSASTARAGHRGRGRRALAVLGLGAGAALVLAGCAAAPSAPDEPPVTLTAVTAADGTAVKQVTLTDHAVERLAILTGTVHQAQVTLDGVTAERKVVPYAAVVYDSDGSTWAYVQSAPDTYVRARLTVATIQADVAVLTDGPPDGTAVVTQGAPELLGAEAEIAGEQ